MHLCRTRKFRKPRNSDAIFAWTVNPRMSSKYLLPPCCATEVLSSRPSGGTSTHVSIYSALKRRNITYFASIVNYTKLCTLEVDLSHLPLSPRPKYHGEGSFYHVDYEIVLLFGLTELKAKLAWKEDVGLLMVHSIPFLLTLLSGC